MYRNVTYSPKDGVMTCWTWDDSGKRVERKHKFQPFLYIEDSKMENPDGISIFDTKLRKKTFKSQTARREFAESYRSRLFFNLDIRQQYILDQFSGISFEDMMKYPLRTFFLDIEIYSPDGFPDLSKEGSEAVAAPINVLTIYDTFDKKFHTWGTKELDDPKLLNDIGLSEDDVVYKYFPDEADMLKDFVMYWVDNYPDMITGWNSGPFDMPYIIRRIKRVLGDRVANLLSPIGKLRSFVRKNVWDRFYTHWSIEGITDVDYMELYAKSEMGDRESLNLDYIGNLELNEGKLAYGIPNHSVFADQHWSGFVVYNVQDVNIMVKLDKKKRYLSIARGKAYRGFSPISKCLDTVPIVTGMVAKSGLDSGKIIVTNKSPDSSQQFDGGHVFRPSGKFCKSIVSFDVKSLYPNTMITLNTSPETKVGKIHRPASAGGKYSIKFVDGKINEYSADELKRFILERNLIKTKADVLFRQDVVGICAKFLDDLYKQRVSIQEKMAEESDPEKKSQMDIEQYLIKILLNSVYGAFGNEYFALYDIDIAASVTLTGQAMIKRAVDISREYVDEKYGIKEDILLYGDTDSNFYDFDKVMEAEGVELVDGIILTDGAKRIIDGFESNLNTMINEWAKRQLNSNDSRYRFAREKVCLNGIFIAKKNYMVRIINNDGKDCDKLMAKGVELVKSSHSKPLKDMMSYILECLFYNLGKAEADNRYYECYNKFHDLPIEDVAKRQRVKELHKWVPRSRGFDVPLGTPQSYRSSINYNHLIDMYSIGNTYPMIQSGTKVKSVYVRSNKYGIKSISFIDKLPEEFELEVDTKTQFSKMITPLIQRCYMGLNWNLPVFDKRSSVDIFDFFGLSGLE